MNQHGIYQPRTQGLQEEEKKGPGTHCACAGISIATSRVTIVIVCGFCMTYSSMDNTRSSTESKQQYPITPHFSGVPCSWHIVTDTIRSACICLPPFYAHVTSQIKEGGERLEMPYTYLWRPAILGIFLFHDFQHVVGLVVGVHVSGLSIWYGSIVCVLMIILTCKLY